MRPPRDPREPRERPRHPHLQVDAGLEALRRGRDARFVGHEGRPPRGQVLRGVRQTLQGADPRARCRGPERGGGQEECPRHARGPGDAAPLGGPRSRGAGAVGDHERLGVRGLRRHLCGHGRGVRQGVLRVADLPARQEHRGGGTGERGLLPPSGQLGVDRPYGRRARREAAAARRRHLGLHDAGPRHGIPPLRGQPPRRHDLRGGQRAELPFPGAQAGA